MAYDAKVAKLAKVANAILALAEEDGELIPCRLDTRDDEMKGFEIRVHLRYVPASAITGIA